MEELLKLLKDGHARTVDMLAIELDTSVEDIQRRIEYLERMHVIKRVPLSPENGGKGCSECVACAGSGKKKSSCAGCMPEGGFRSMGEMWEVL